MYCTLYVRGNYRMRKYKSDMAEEKRLHILKPYEILTKKSNYPTLII